MHSYFFTENDDLLSNVGVIAVVRANPSQLPMVGKYSLTSVTASDRRTVSVRLRLPPRIWGALFASSLRIVHGHINHIYSDKL